ncbi:DUF305 domain-containing protein [Dietzia natronolimnaea]|uniref:DUF305 domain-containing protein n=1 Tax=Dietzia natronolimnaea TaxID=161920 RepID=A0A2A2WRH2_9ACTN|nr:DUF305 domain-containing protein [Dietzia natronolimnaea]PAY23574.1 DUF305 domain-containing protein [Dietzia natronolimnaea]
MIRKPKVVTTVAAAALLALSACTNDGDDTTAAEPTTTSTTSVVEETGTDTPGEAGEHSEADVMFAQMMLPHHEQAIEMSDMILAKDGIPQEVTQLAEEIKAAQGPEIEQLTEWLDQWGEPTEPEGGHDGHDMAEMDGMLSDEELQQLSDAEGTDAARLFLEQMIAHHEGAVTMAEDEVADGTYPPAVDLAQTIIDTQQAEIETMRDLLNSL